MKSRLKSHLWPLQVAAVLLVVIYNIDEASSAAQHATAMLLFFILWVLLEINKSLKLQAQGKNSDR